MQLFFSLIHVLLLCSTSVVCTLLFDSVELFSCGHLDVMALELVRQRACLHLFVRVCERTHRFFMCERDECWNIGIVSRSVPFGDAKRHRSLHVSPFTIIV